MRKIGRFLKPSQRGFRIVSADGDVAERRQGNGLGVAHPIRPASFPRLLERIFRTIEIAKFLERIAKIAEQGQLEPRKPQSARPGDTLFEYLSRLLQPAEFQQG